MIPKSEYDSLNEKTMKLVSKYKEAEKELKELKLQQSLSSGISTLNSEIIKSSEEYLELDTKYKTLNDKVYVFIYIYNLIV